MTACYVTGKGKHASSTTWAFKTSVITMLEETGLGFDTRFRYYRQQYPELANDQLARLICDPMEYYDQDWPAYRDGRSAACSEEQAATAFMLALDNRFRDEAEAVIACYDEAGFGSGVNAMYFLNAGKPILGFYNREVMGPTINLSNLLQLTIAYPDLCNIVEYQHAGEIPTIAQAWLEQRSRN